MSSRFRAGHVAQGVLFALVLAVMILTTPPIGLHSVGPASVPDGPRGGGGEVSASNPGTGHVSPRASPIPPGVLSQVPLTILNRQSTPTGGSFQQMVVVNSSRWSSYEAANLSNIEFYYPNGTIIPSWIESNASNLASNTTYWLNLSAGIPSDASATVYMGFASTGTVLFNGVDVGEAPTLSATYAQFDNGGRVFDHYTDFVGTSLPAGWAWDVLAGSGASYTVNNGVSITTNGAGDTDGALASDFPTTGDTVEAQVSSFSNGGNSNAWVMLASPDPSSITYSNYLPDCVGWQNGVLLTINSDIGGTPAVVTRSAINPTSGFILGVQGSSLFVNYHVGATITGNILGSGYLASEVGSGSTVPSVHDIWYRVRTTPPNGVMPTVAFGHLYLFNGTGGSGPSSTKFSIVTHAQNLTLVEATASQRITSVGGFTPLLQPSPNYVLGDISRPGLSTIFVNTSAPGTVAVTGAALSVASQGAVPIVQKFQSFYETNQTLLLNTTVNTTSPDELLVISEVGYTQVVNGVLGTSPTKVNGQTAPSMTAANGACLQLSGGVYSCAGFSNYWNATVPGSYSVTDGVQSTNGGQAEFVVALEFPTSSPPLTVAVSARPPTVASGQATSFWANATGGTPPYTYAWRFGDGSTASVADPVHTYGAPGNYLARVWVNDSSGTGVSKVIATVPVGSEPQAPIFDASNGLTYVPNYASGNVSVLSGTSVLASVQMWTGSSVLNYPAAVVNTTDGEVYVVAPNGANAGMVGAVSGATAEGNVSTGCAVGSGAVESVAWDPSNGFVYVAFGSCATVYVLSGSTLAVLASPSVGSGTKALVYDPANGYVYDANGGSANVYVFSGTSVVTSFSMGSGAGYDGGVYVPTDGYLYFTNYWADTVSVISGTSDIGSIPVGAGPGSIQYDPLDHALFVSDTSSTTVSVISTTTDTEVATVPVGSSPQNFALDLAGDDVYVGNGGSSNVTEISGGTDHVVSNVAVGSDSRSLAYDPSDQDIYVANSGSGNVSIISPELPASANGSVAITVGAALAISSFTAAPSSFTLGSSTDLAVTASGGVGALAYQYTGLPAGCSTADLSSLPCTPTATGAFSVNVFVNDSAGHSVSAQASFTVLAGSPTISSFTVSPTLVQVGLAATFTVAASGGSPPLSYVYTGLPAGCSTSSSASLSCTPTAAGSYTVTVFVNDSAGHSANANVGLTVTAAPPTISSFTVSPTTVQVGSEANFTVAASGGTPPLSYAYSGLPSGCSTQDAAKLSCAPTAAGSYTVIVFVNDSASRSTSATTDLTVDAGTVITLSRVSVLPTSAEVEAGGTTSSFTATPSCSAACPGTGIAYQWSLSQPSLGSLASPSSPTTTFTAGSTAGTLELFVNATLNGAVRQATVTLIISSAPLPTLASVSISPASGSIATGATQTFTTSLLCTGGSCPAGVTYAWSLSSNLGSLSSLSGASTVFTAGNATGSLTLKVAIALNGKIAWANASLTVTSSGGGPSPGFLGLGGDAGELLVGVVVALLVVITALLLLKRRKGGPTASTSPAEPPDEPQTQVGPPVAYPPEPYPPSPNVAGWAPGVAPATGASVEVEPGAPVAPGPPPVPSGSPAQDDYPVAPGPVLPPAPPPAAPPRAWPMSPLTCFEVDENASVYYLASTSGLEREKMLIIAPEAPGTLRGTYGLAGADVWRLTRTEGEQNVSPSDLDRLGDIIVRHLEKGTGRAAVLVGIEKIVDAGGLKGVLRLMEVVSETAETNRGTVLVGVPTLLLKPEVVRQLEDGATLMWR